MGETSTVLPATLLELLDYRSQQQAQQLAYRFLLDGEDATQEVTYGELGRQVRWLAQRLRSQTQVRDRILLLYPSGLDFIVAFLGCLYAGLVPVPAYPPKRNQNMARLQAIFKDAGAELALTTSALATMIQRKFSQTPALAGINVIVTDTAPETAVDSDIFSGVFPDVFSDITSAALPYAATDETLAFLQYTSGSTGAPKGVMVSHGNLMHNLKQVKHAFGHSEESIVVGWLPLFHDMGLIGNALQPLYVGFPCTLMAPVHFLQKPVRWLQAVSRYGATTSGGPNFAYDLCCRKVSADDRASLDLSRWELAYNGAEPIRAQTLAAFAEQFADCGFSPNAFYPCYGLAESTLFVTGGQKQSYPKQQPVPQSMDPALVDAQDAQRNRSSTGFAPGSGAGTPAAATVSSQVVSCGSTGVGSQVVIVDPKTGQMCAEGNVGEIWVSGESVAQGYWQQPELTAATFAAQLQRPAVSDPAPDLDPLTTTTSFLRTGDLGFLYHAELYVTGRLKDLLIIQGRNHYPQDIEHTVEQSHDLLRAGCSAAFSVAAPTPANPNANPDASNTINPEQSATEQLVVAVEVERRGMKTFDLKAVAGAVRQAIVQNYGLQPQALCFLKIGTLPKTSSGKIQRQACRQAFLEDSLTLVAQWTQPDRPKPNSIGNVEQTLNGEETNLDPLLRKYPTQHFNASIESTPAQTTVSAEAASGPNQTDSKSNTHQPNTNKPSPNQSATHQSNTNLHPGPQTTPHPSDTQFTNGQVVETQASTTVEIIQAWIIHWLAQQLELDVSQFDPAQPLTDYGLDSVIAMEFALQLETWLNQPVSVEILWDFPTAETLSQQLAQQVGDEDALRLQQVGPIL